MPKQTVLLVPVVVPGNFPQLMGASNDGRLVLYRVTRLSVEGPAIIVDAATGRSPPFLLANGELAKDGTMSGFGNAAFLLTTTGRIARVDLTTGALADAVPATPYIRNSFQFSPGSLVRLEGSSPIQPPLSPMPFSWTAVQYRPCTRMRRRLEFRCRGN